MKKLIFLVGVGVGFLLGSKTGSGPYQELETKVRSVANRRDVQEAVEMTKDAAREQVADVVTKVADKLPTVDDVSVPSRSSSRTSV